MTVQPMRVREKLPSRTRWRGRLIWIQCPLTRSCRQMMVRIAIMKKRKLRPTIWKIPNIRIIIFWKY